MELHHPKITDFCHVTTYLLAKNFTETISNNILQPIVGLTNKQAGRRLDLCLAKISLPWQQGSAHILHGSIELAIPENPLVGPNISGLSAIQADL